MVTNLYYLFTFVFEFLAELKPYFAIKQTFLQLNDYDMMREY